MTDSTLLAPAGSLALPPGRFFEDLRTRLAAGARPLAFYGRPADDPADVTLTAVLEEDGALAALRTDVSRARGFHTLSREHPPLHVFEREIFEQHGAKPHDHPWPKPVRFPAGAPGEMDRFPFYRLEGKGVHEVAVGPVHAGVIEPGHFRFMCLGELVHHLEIHLGYQHRGVEPLLLRRDPRTLAPLVETIAGDTSVAHAWAYAGALEALAGVAPSPEREVSRGIGLELERIGMHLAGLSGIANDVAFLQGAATYGRLRTTAINTTMRVCGSRFGRGWVRPGALPAAIEGEVADALHAALALLDEDLVIVNERMDESASVQHRLVGTGVVATADALEVGLVGPSARASGVPVDVREQLPGALYRRFPVAAVVEAGGDCHARAQVRVREIAASIAWIRAALEEHPALPRAPGSVGPLAPGMLAVAVREGWRGEVVHALETGADGRLRHYKVQDPSLRNWFGLALAVRNNDISDFPLCNKSFDLSYCGNDL